MCTKITCNTCAKPTWQGCGEHIEAALGDVAVADRCACDRDAAPASAFGSHPTHHNHGGISLGSW